MTVVDYSGLEQQGIARAKTCPPGNEQCRENASAVIGPGYWKQDERGALAYATLKLLQRDAKVTSYTYDWQDLVEGYFLQLTNNADQSRTFAYLAMHEHKLYIVEGTVAKGAPLPGLFQQSLGWVDKDGRAFAIRPSTPTPFTAWAVIRNLPSSAHQVDDRGASPAREGCARAQPHLIAQRINGRRQPNPRCGRPAARTTRFSFLLPERPPGLIYLEADSCL